MSNCDDSQELKPKSSRNKVLAVLAAVLVGILSIGGFQAGWNSEVGWYMNLGPWAWTSLDNHMEQAFKAVDLGDFDEAEKHLKAVEEFVSANPDDSSISISHDASRYDIREVVHYNLAKVYEQKGDTGEEYQAALLSCRPNTAACYIYSSQAKALRGKIQDAIDIIPLKMRLRRVCVLLGKKRRACSELPKYDSADASLKT